MELKKTLAIENLTLKKRPVVYIYVIRKICKYTLSDHHSRFTEENFKVSADYPWKFYCLILKAMRNILVGAGASACSLLGVYYFGINKNNDTMPPRRMLSSRPQSVQGVNCHKAPSAVDGTATQVAFSVRDVMPGVHNSHSRTESSIQESRRLLQRAMLEQGIPGGVVTVSVDGSIVWSEGLGYSDVENHVPCSPESVMRIASISKPLTAVGLLQLCQEGKVDLDACVRTYVLSFPEKEFEGRPVTITTRQLLSHMAGVRHYTKKGVVCRKLLIATYIY